jgi:DNA (cytosine-5)-methyltransferase 1
LQPKFIISENVAALAIRGLGRIINDLYKIGYNVEWHNISASAIGGGHHRERLFIVAYPNTFRNNDSTQKVFELRNLLSKPTSRQIDLPLSDKWYESGRNTNILRTIDGLSGKLDRLKGLGNSIVPQIAQLLFEQIKEHIYE